MENTSDVKEITEETLKRMERRLAALERNAVEKQHKLVPTIARTEMVECRLTGGVGGEMLIVMERKDRVNDLLVSIANLTEVGYRLMQGGYRVIGNPTLYSLANVTTMGVVVLSAELSKLR